jgi:predicted nuclease with TOPRIM domain
MEVSMQNFIDDLLNIGANALIRLGSAVADTPEAKEQFRESKKELDEAVSELRVVREKLAETKKKNKVLEESLTKLRNGEMTLEEYELATRF